MPFLNYVPAITLLLFPIILGLLLLLILGLSYLISIVYAYAQDIRPSEENIIISGMLYGLTKEQIMSKIPDILRFSELEDFSQMKLKHFSTGMRLRLAFSTAIQIDPDILIIDEILAVGDMSFRKKSLEFFLDFKKRNKTIILTTHSVNLIKELCDRVLLLEKGKALIIGNPTEVIQN